MPGPGVTTFQSLSTARKVLILSVTLGLIVGLTLAPIAFDAAVEPRPDRIAVVPIEGTLEGANVFDVTQRLTEARQDPSIDAVVLLVNSPGGLAVAGEEIFQQVQRTSQEKPVVAHISVSGTSAGYKVTLPADEVYASPASSVGSVGTFLIRPQPMDPIDVLIESGPQKLDGDTPRGYEYSVEMISGSFHQAVFDHRGEELQMTREELAEARIYTGIESAELGLVDGISDTNGAIEAAARLSESDHYEVSVMNYETEVLFLDRAAYAASTQPHKSMMTVDDLLDTDGTAVVPTPMMLPATALASMESVENASVDMDGGEVRAD